MNIGWTQRLDRRKVAHPERMIPLAFLIGIAFGTLLLWLPLSRAAEPWGSAGAPLLVALFTATSALCVTGLTLVDTPTYWSPFGQATILALMQLGGLGIMTGATLIGLYVTRAMRLSGRLLASSEMRNLELGDLRAVVRLVLTLSLAVEAVLTLLLFLRFWLGYGMPAGDALWHGLFHAVSAFNNAGFSTLPEGMAAHAADGWLLTPLMIGVLLGGIGFPVVHELRKAWRRPASWSIHTKLTLLGTVGLTLIGMAGTLLFELDNPRTFGNAGWWERTLGALFHSVMLRSGGFATHDIAGMEPATHLLSTGLMLIGGGSASTAGGIRITTFLLLGFVFWAEVRGQPDAIAFRRRIAPAVQRQALTLVLAAVGMLSIALLALAALERMPIERLLFDAVSAFGTVGLTAGPAADMGAGGQLILILLMYIGRVGTVSLAAAIALKARHSPYRYPEERPLVG